MSERILFLLRPHETRKDGFSLDLISSLSRYLIPKDYRLNLRKNRRHFAEKESVLFAHPVDHPKVYIVPFFESDDRHYGALKERKSKAIRSLLERNFSPEMQEKYDAINAFVCGDSGKADNIESHSTIGSRSHIRASSTGYFYQSIQFYQLSPDSLAKLLPSTRDNLQDKLVNLK